jgi:hypothetical protein
MLNSNLIEYAIVEVQGATAEEVSQRMGKIAELALAHDTQVEVLISGMVILSRGTLPQHLELKTLDPFILTLLEIQKELSENVRIIFKKEFAHFGNLGSPARFSYGFIAPSFLKTVQQIADVPFGKILELE